MIDITILENGNLSVTLESSAMREEFAADVERLGSDIALWVATESYWTNGLFHPFDAGDANPCVGLTSAPCIAESMDTDDDGKNTIVGRAWAYLNYQVRDFADDILQNGFAIFTRI